ncbi:helix-turn-helix domain-containing protein [Bacteroides sp.]|uniref:helix-turn-helix domain-containing protein n=1 Tax=Bacteroides sp. TaxID=29523 RepID=UPI003AB6064B
MKCNIYPGVLWGFLFLFLILPVSAQSSRQQKKDSLRLVIAKTEGTERLEANKKLVALYQMEVNKDHVLDTILTIYDAMKADARKLDDLKELEVIYYNRLAAISSKHLNDEVIRQSPATLDFFAGNKQWKSYYLASNMLIEAYNNLGKYEEALSKADSIYNFAKAQNDRGGMGVVLYSISRIYTLQRRFPEAEKCLRESVDMLQDQPSYIHMLATISNRLVQNLIAQEHYDEALKTAHETEEVNRRYEEASKSSQPSAWCNLWFSYIDLYRQTNDFDQAQFYLDKVDSITKGSVKLYKERGHVLFGKRRYREALEMLDKAIEASPNALEAKGLKLMTLIRMNEPEEAIELFYKVIEDLNAMHDKDYNAKLDEIRTQYEVDKYIAEKERNRIYFLFTLGICLFLILLLGGVVYYNRIIAAKNRNLYRQIKEQDRIADELLLLKQASAQEDDAASPVSEALPGSNQQRQLVERLQEYLLTDKNLCDTNVARSEITTALGVNKNQLTEAIKAVTGKMPMEYIRTLQLEEARHLLDRHPELNIESIAYDCGFNTPSTFYRLFRKRYGISPSEYRKLSEAQQD